MGFSRNQKASISCTTFTAVSTLPYAVTTMVGGISPDSRIRRRNSKPSMPGMLRSVTTTSAGDSASLSRASWPSAAVEGAMPQAETMAANPLRWVASSSTIRTLRG